MCGTAVGKPHGHNLLYTTDMLSVNDGDVFLRKTALERLRQK